MDYHKVFIFYFSGTGNAKNTAYWIGDEFEKHGVKAEVSNIAHLNFSEIPRPPEYSLVGFISPTHGFHFPQLMRSFIKHFPKVKNGGAFVINTRAGLRIGNICLPGLSGVVHYWSSIYIKMKGFNIKGLYPVDLPSNWLFLHPAVRKKGVKKIYGHVEPKVRKFTKQILNGKNNYRALYDFIQDLIISPVSLGYVIVGQYVFAKSFISSRDCDMCGLCRKSCPVQAIKQVDGRMFWTSKCESCMKCMNICPKRAIETAHGFVTITVIMTILLFTYLMEQAALMFSDVVIFWLQKWYIKLIIARILFYLILIAGYRAMHWLMQYRMFERLFVLSSLSTFRFWGRYNVLSRSIEN